MKAINPEVLKSVVAFLNLTGDYDEKSVLDKLTAARKKKHAERSIFEVTVLALYQYHVMIANETKTTVPTPTGE